jgi:hypothetical protein
LAIDEIMAPHLELKGTVTTSFTSGKIGILQKGNAGR